MPHCNIGLGGAGATPDGGRGRAIGVAASGIIAAQGAAVLLGGLLSDALDPATAVAVAGMLGAVLSAGGAVAWRRASVTTPAVQPGAPTARSH